MADINSKVPLLRERFLEKYSGSILDDTFDSRDVDWVKTDDRLIRATLKASRSGPGDIEKAADVLNKSLTFRAKMKMNDLKETDLHPELREGSRVYYKGKDKEGNPILIMNVSMQKKGHLIEEGKQFIAFYVNKKYRENPEQKIVCIFDFWKAGLSNMDLDISRFIVDAFGYYFPSVYAYNLMFKMPLALEAVYKIISGWMDSDQSKNTHFVKRTTIQKYVDADQLEPHMLKDETNK